MKRYYHKATLDGFLNLMYDFNVSEPLACSTDIAHSLFGRDIAVVFNTDIKPSEYSLYDIDAHSVTAWDEARIQFDSFESFKNSIEYVILSPNKLKLKEALSGKLLRIFNEDGEPFSATEKKIEKFFNNKENINKEFNFNVLYSHEAINENSNWDETFLNIKSSKKYKK